MARFARLTQFFSFLAVACLATFLSTLSTEVASAQATSQQTEGLDEAQALTSPVAFVYVGSSPSTNTYQIDGFAVAPNGELTPVPESPFVANALGGIAVSGQHLFATNTIDIYSFAIEADGSLRKVSTVNARQFNGAACGGPSPLFVSHAGTILYDVDNYGSQCANNTYQAFTIESSGKLSYLGMTSAASPVFNTPLSFLGNNKYGYSSSCYHYSAGIYEFSRSTTGALTLSGNAARTPTAASGDFYCTYLTAADPTNHVAISVQQLSGSTWATVGSPQLATYTAGTSGHLTTKSTFSNMPHTAVQFVTDLKMSPSGKLLAVAGSAGLQVFHFNGSDPITHYTARLTTDSIDQMFWDNANHLYAISRSTNKLFVFTITPYSAKQAPGSPYTITVPMNIAVLPKS
jgi:6-phosphogluconolactonase (cycloisomerase 2 family)